MKPLEVAVVGAGPYGLSVAAHLVGHVDFRLFGGPLATWRDQMPAGMLLRSESFASNLSDPARRLTLARYASDHGFGADLRGAPVPVETFRDYGGWFIESAGLPVEETFVTNLSRRDGGFALELESGESLRARRVVVATGLTRFAYVPEVLVDLPPELATHSSAHNRLDDFAGRSVTVIGSGQSALETAALLHECGASVHLVARADALTWLAAPSPRPERLRRPVGGLCAGWDCLAYEHAAPAFRRLPASRRLNLVATRFGPAGAYWLRERVDGKIKMSLATTIRTVQVDGAGLHLEVDSGGGTTFHDTDHVIAATGYRVDLSRLTFLADVLRELRLTGPGPALSARFESSAPGLFFVGAPCAMTFGPLMRFVVGTRFAARRVAHAVKSR